MDQKMINDSTCLCVHTILLVLKQNPSFGSKGLSKPVQRHGSINCMSIKRLFLSTSLIKYADSALEFISLLSRNYYKMNGITVFDFDWSLIDEDSDYWAIHSLSPEIWQQVLEKRGQLQWTDLMDYALIQLQESGWTKDDIAEKLATIPFSLEMRNTLLNLKKANIPVILLSDSNTFYINTILTAYGVQDCVTEIITNPAYIDEQGRLRVHRHILATDTQHACVNPCSINICKGIELDKIITKYGGLTSIPKIAYTGDGRNDFCPATRLRPTDVFFMRTNRSLESYLYKFPTQKQKIKAQFTYWTTPSSIWQAYFNQ